ncbi:unnamed protein product [Symbiodinium sp. CCMP2592]|nr:unnamed protein product [Symbiodinium sp. CCMP2592]
MVRIPPVTGPKMMVLVHLSQQANIQDTASHRPEDDGAAALVPAGEHPGPKALALGEHHGEDTASHRPEDDGAGALVPAGEHPVKTVFPSISRGQHMLDIEGRMDMVKPKGEEQQKLPDGREETRSVKKKRAVEKDPLEREDSQKGTICTFSVVLKSTKACCEIQSAVEAPSQHKGQKEDAQWKGPASAKECTSRTSRGKHPAQPAKPTLPRSALVSLTGHPPSSEKVSKQKHEDEARNPTDYSKDKETTDIAQLANGSARRPDLSAIPRSWQRQQRRRLSQSSTPKSTTSGPNSDELSVEKLLLDQCHKPKVTLYHMRERVPAMEKAGKEEDLARFKNHLAALHAAEALRPSSVGKLEDDHIGQHLLTLQPFWPGPLPLVTCKGLVQRRCERLTAGTNKNIARCFEVLWPKLSENLFNAEEARVATLAMSQEDKVTFAHDIVVSYCLPEMMQNDDVAGLQELSETMLQKSADEPELMKIEKAKLMVQTVRAVGALVQSLPVRDDQLEAWTKRKHNPVLSIAATSKVAKLLQSAAWRKRLDRFWLGASTQVLHEPVVRDCLEALKGGDEEKLDAAWADLQANWGAWSRELNTETLAFLAEAVQKHLALDLQKLHSRLLHAEESEPEDTADARAAELVRVFNLREGWARKVAILGQSFSLERENFQSTIDKLNVRLRSRKALAWLDAALDPGKELSPEDVESATAALCHVGIAGKSTEARAWLDRLVNDPALGIATCELAIAVVKAMMIPQDSEQLPRLSKTLTGLKIEHHVSSGPGHDIESLSALIKSWDDLQVASYKDLEEAVAKARVCLQTSSHDAFRVQLQSSFQAFSDLKLHAGGTDSGGNWKADLPSGPSGPTWDALCTLARQTVLRDRLRPFHKDLDKHFASVQKSFAELQEALSWPDLPAEAQEARDLLAQGPEVFQLARITGTEVYFMETILLVRSDRHRPRLKKRLDSLKEFDVPVKQVHPLIWQKVNEILGEE